MSFLYRDMIHVTFQIDITLGFLPLVQLDDRCTLSKTEGLNDRELSCRLIVEHAMVKEKASFSFLWMAEY